MNNKQRSIFRVVLAIIFLIGGIEYFIGGNVVSGVAFVLAGGAFGYNAYKSWNKEGR